MTTSPEGNTPPLRIGAVSIDCADPERLADFYCKLLGMKRIVETPGGRVVAVSDGTHTLAMMRIDGYIAPSWPHTKVNCSRCTSTSPSPTSTAPPRAQCRSGRG